jgi:UDP:flavonoid glycosyltransferase YjiC (YdhE family)
MLRIAFFISPHGFGHAARASAVMLALRERQPNLSFEIYTRVPEWFFQDTLKDGFSYHSLLTDIGMAQHTPMEEDAPETLRRLQAFLPFPSQLLDSLAAILLSSGCRLVVSDISPLGIAAARQAGLPSILLENFTWDWIYASYLDEAPGLAEPMAALREIFSQADVHIQAEPVCSPQLAADLVASPISRSPRTNRDTLHQQIGIPAHQKVVLITLGGIEGNVTVSQKLSQVDDLFFIIPGASTTVERQGNQLLLPHHSGFYHPDLLHASDAVVGKPGYSTLAEAYAAGIPFAYLPRPRFREYPVLADFIEHQIGGFAVSLEEYAQGEWIDRLRDLLKVQPRQPHPENGANQVADFILQEPQCNPPVQPPSGSPPR